MARSQQATASTNRPTWLSRLPRLGQRRVNSSRALSENEADQMAADIRA
jgi:hypothetical protein